MPMNSQHLIISYVETLPLETFGSFRSDLKIPGLKVLVEPRPPDVFAGIEWLMPTAVVVYIARPYFEAFLKEMGKDHYLLLKRALQQLSIKFLGKNAGLTRTLHTKGKIDTENQKYSLEFSIVAEVEARVRVKLLFDTSLSEDEYANVVKEFLDWLERLQGGVASLAELENFASTRVISGTVLVVFNQEKNRFEVIDPLRKENHHA
jgi:hypothetical protein